jgi:hypothetical protein
MGQVHIERRGRTAVLTLDDPKRRNALSLGLCAALKDTVEELEADDTVGALVVTGQPPAFCAGANLGNLAEASEESLGHIYEGFLKIARSPLPTIAAVNAASCALLLSRQVRLCALKTGLLVSLFLGSLFDHCLSHTPILLRLVSPHLSHTFRSRVPAPSPTPPLCVLCSRGRAPWAACASASSTAS